MAKLNIERGFISKLLETKDFKTIKDQQIKSSFFEGEHKRVFKFIQEVYTTTGEVPTSRVLKSKFPTYKLETNSSNEVGTEENLTFWCVELRQKVKHNRIADLIEESAGLVNDEKLDEAYAEVKKNIILIEQDVTISKSVNITENADSRKEAYLKKKENKGITGYSTGMPSLDFAIGGVNPEEFTVIAGKTGMGKTWAEVILGSFFMLNDLKVLQLTAEMSATNLQDRYESILFQLTHGGFDYNQFKHGSLPPIIEEDYFDFLDNTLPSMTPLIINDTTSVLGVQADIERYNPDIILIDGLYAMQDDQGAKDDWLRVQHVSRDLKQLNKRTGIPIIANTQLDIDSKGGLSGIKYAKAIAQDADNVIELWRDDVMITDREMKWKVIKNREGMPTNIITHWDFTCMNFAEIYSENGSKEALEWLEENGGEEESNSNVIGV